MSQLSVSTVQSLAASTPPVFQDSAGTQIGTLCRAWVNFNGTGTVAIRAAVNVSSITDNGVGDYTVNFATAMVDANYSAQSATDTSGAGVGFSISTPISTLATNVKTRTTSSGTLTDATTVQVAIFR